ncbi:ABC transporter ATP-binding protein [Mycobacterium avium subsp. hominissuis]|uniref:ABC transporter ATP-binding protein n=1 Tax=Mycobacterium timonense TaxID=701043 RepID=A0ABX3TNS2_9MYCO|nr:MULTISPECIES: ABC transporter ATP-binding protein [Mycobacterium avium complex (MAC)]MBZ4510878.1 ABC transporter ATP-binding protein [Mycobacterium avium subsp. hominissuis]MBZ4549352.1 ABC transporter ATP-binding protein [Mycobacterium avium subsp. hominissuis]MBZ4581367.1 ABC transporter ATP-binding protein [Mycobacterium avium subsp. hominissuis]MBZ4597936.1 ABC transporter ATP-binding protein [Mycobacterium avium subsp. hominissuis]ORB80487.1 ABC transporter ATP-binding protein [Mycoba
MGPPLLDVSGLTVTYPGAVPRVALDRVDLAVSSGEFVAVVGESGSGKTTLANAVVGLLPAAARITAGSLAIAGRDVLGLSERQWCRLRGSTVGLVPQDPATSLNPVRSIGSQIAEIFPLKGERLSRREARRRCIELLDRVEIDRPAQRLKQYPGELSGGMRQRVLIAIAFALNPGLLIADEPTSALDVTVQRHVLAVFDRLVAEHRTTVVFITHDIGVATDHASRIVVMRGGVVVEDAPAEAIVAAPRTEYAAHLVRRLTASAPAAAPAGSEDVIEVAGVAKEFRLGARARHTAVAEVAFTVRRGETLALVGESGSGKSTTAKMVVGLLTPTRGTVRVLGRDVAALPARTRRRHCQDIQFVYQNPGSALDPRWTVRQILDGPLRSYRVDDRARRAQRIAEALVSVGLSDDKLDRRPGELSGGECQRVAIARALVLRPQIVVLDEPLSALDVVTQDQIVGLLLRLQRQLGLTYLFVSHDLSVVRRLAHRVVVLRAGRVVETGDTAAVFAAPAADYTRALLDAVPGRRLAHPALSPS